jgi:deazaflavin-dependent oxidoreductase (nitroreductase family)
MRQLHLGPNARRAVRFVARLVNPLTLLVAGRSWMPIVGVLEHRGRKTGRIHSTPLGMRPYGDSFVMPLTFSAEAAWYRNVRAAEWAVVRYRGREHMLVGPEVIDYATAAPAFPGYELLQFRLVGITEYLRMRQAPSGWLPSTNSAPSMARARTERSR